MSFQMMTWTVTCVLGISLGQLLFRKAALALPAQITVRIVGEPEGRQLNRDFRGKDYATNVLTFDYSREPVVSADLVLCAPGGARGRRASQVDRGSLRPSAGAWRAARPRLGP